MKIYSIILLVAFALCSCHNPVQQPAPKPETPKALQEKTSVYTDVKSLRGRGDLMEDIYIELVEKDPQLKDLESQIGNFDEKKNDSLETFKMFDAKNSRYYQDAKQHYETISDSTLKLKIKSLLEASQSAYAGKTAGIHALIEQINKKQLTLNDLHVLLKIARTLQVMEKYQNENLPSAKPIESIEHDLNNMIKKANSLSGVK